MVVKILSSGAGFSGIKYNENKVSIGSAQLMASENFGLLDMDSKTKTIPELESFFKAWSMAEKGTISKPQFHVAISCKGKETSGEELTRIAQEYIKKMGYQDNPYLIYFHSDTANNHVHIVSSRVNESGLKINDSFERRRSQAAMKEILAQDPEQEVGEQVKRALTYNFSTEAQFKLLLEKQGITVKRKEPQYQFIKYGAVNHQESNLKVDNKIKAYQEPSERIKQIKALFLKYKPALTPEKFSEFMREKFGVELVFHTAKGKDTAYGYTIIDHGQQQVLKGSQVLKLSDLLALAPKAGSLQAAAELLSTLAENNQLRYREFKQQLAHLCFELNPSGAVRLAGEEQVSLAISKDRMRQVLYNDRLYEANKFALATPAEAEIIRRVFHLKKEDRLNYQFSNDNNGREQAKTILSDKLNSLLATGKELVDIAKENHYAFAKNGGEVYLVDQKNYALYPVSELTHTKLNYTGISMIDANKPVYLGGKMEQSSGSFGELAAELISLLDPAEKDEQTQDNKRKNKRRIK
ncbi:relaxase/mobilization nuclease domain-containing protein (plasmid) [Adhaeribacter swui]|uniref:Relaxase/mobilization nuclease domain-containing protein n=1 Tax=Adhaeribacter swui TaxID=2086471 RepID=A0A7G7G2F9_9BACT|nr:relaxase/mobilization nuclease domain-containing protein [Adhaeribacter swui]QNF31343.1 relaxase/mobilization nuclease domain-containing protein [Adhaeribacter swui]